MDPTLIKRISQAKDRGLSVRLHTNATLFNEDKVRELARLGNTRLIVNLPSADKAEYERINKSKLFDRVVGNLTLMHEHGVPTQLSINSPRHATDAVVRPVRVDTGAAGRDPPVVWQLVQTPNVSVCTLAEGRAKRARCARSSGRRRAGNF